MLIRIVLFAVLVLLAVRFVILLVHLARGATLRGVGVRRPGSPSIDLVRCRRCGVMVPGFRAVPDGADEYACRTCAGR